MSVLPAHESSPRTKDDVLHEVTSNESRMVDSIGAAILLSFAGGALNSFLWLNHGQVYAGVMTGNAVLFAINLITGNFGGAGHYAWALFAYAVGIWLVSMLQAHVKRNTIPISLSIVIVGLIVASFLPGSFPNTAYVFLVVSLTGFLVGSARNIDGNSYNVTVLTGSLRDATIALYKSLNPLTRANSLSKARDLWIFILSFCTGAAAGGLLGKHFGNHALWMPVAAIAVVVMMVLQAAASVQRQPEALPGPAAA